MGRLAILLGDLARVEAESQARLKAAAAPPPSPEARLGLPLTPGAKVVDMVSGQEGEVLAGTTTHYLNPAT